MCDENRTTRGSIQVRKMQLDIEGSCKNFYLQRVMSWPLMLDLMRRPRVDDSGRIVNSIHRTHYSVPIGNLLLILALRKVDNPV